MFFCFLRQKQGANIKSIMIAFEYEIRRFSVLTQTTSHPKTEVLMT